MRMTSLEKLSIPGLWIFSDNDASIPVDLSSRLKRLTRSGHRYEYVLFPGLGHNNMDGTFSAATDWIRRSTKQSGYANPNAFRACPLSDAELAPQYSRLASNKGRTSMRTLGAHFIAWIAFSTLVACAREPQARA